MIDHTVEIKVWEYVETNERGVFTHFGFAEPDCLRPTFIAPPRSSIRVPDERPIATILAPEGSYVARVGTPKEGVEGLLLHVPVRYAAPPETFVYFDAERAVAAARGGHLGFHLLVEPATPMPQPARTGSGWLNTQSGRKLFPLDPDPEQIDIGDIAHALSHMPRFAGMTDRFYSVAQHSVIVSRMVPEADAPWGLLHDASEAYLMDLPRPLKRLPEFAFYREAEKRLMAAVCERFGLPPEEPASVKEVDARMVPTEARDLFTHRHPDWKDAAKPFDDLRIAPLSPADAWAAFAFRFADLTRTAPVAPT